MYIICLFLNILYYCRIKKCYKIFSLCVSGARPEDGVRDMIIISDIDENGININLKTRYKEDQIYVSFMTKIEQEVNILNCT